MSIQVLMGDSLIVIHFLIRECEFNKIITRHFRDIREVDKILEKKLKKPFNLKKDWPVIYQKIHSQLKE